MSGLWEWAVVKVGPLKDLVTTRSFSGRGGSADESSVVELHDDLWDEVGPLRRGRQLNDVLDANLASRGGYGGSRRGAAERSFDIRTATLGAPLAQNKRSLLGSAAQGDSGTEGAARSATLLSTGGRRLGSRARHTMPFAFRFRSHHAPQAHTPQVGPDPRMSNPNAHQQATFKSSAPWRRGVSRYFNVFTPIEFESWSWFPSPSP